MFARVLQRSEKINQFYFYKSANLHTSSSRPSHTLSFDRRGVEMQIKSIPRLERLHAEWFFLRLIRNREENLGKTMLPDRAQYRLSMRRFFLRERKTMGMGPSKQWISIKQWVYRACRLLQTMDLHQNRPIVAKSFWLIKAFRLIRCRFGSSF